jgi:hypothetical protein
VSWGEIFQNLLKVTIPKTSTIVTIHETADCVFELSQVKHDGVENYFMVQTLKLILPTRQ